MERKDSSTNPGDIEDQKVHKGKKHQRVQVHLANQEVKGWFLTYPKCPISPTEALGLFRALDIKADIVEYVIASELHQDGDPHIHAFLKFESKVSIDQEWRRFDLRSNGHLYHGHYEAAASYKRVKDYCKKDGNYIASFDLDAALHKKAKLNKRLLVEDPCELVDSGDVSIYQLKSLMQGRDIYNSLKSPTKPRAQHLVANPFGFLLPVYTVKTKKRHWWFWSKAPNTGKTSFLRDLAQNHPCHWMARERFQAMHPGTQFILLDEYTSPWLPIFELNQMCDGTFQYPSKGGSPVCLQDPIVVVCSNKHPNWVYPNFYELINARFLVFETKMVYLTE